jgi:hypothetical protein
LNTKVNAFISNTVLPVTSTASSTTAPTSLSQLSQLDGASDDQQNLVEHGVTDKLDTSVSTMRSSSLSQLTDLSYVNTIKEGSTSSLPWHDVAITKASRHLINEYFLNNNLETYKSETSIESDSIKKQLEPGTAYKLRVAALNICGRGPWSEVSVFVTCKPDFPSAPCSIKISKIGEDVYITWEPPQIINGTIKGYAVYLSVNSLQSHQQTTQQPVADSLAQQQLSFIQVYSGTEPNCIVSAEILSRAHIDTNGKPAVLFRIAAKNEKGYGSATQVRWLQGNLFLFKIFLMY